MTYRLILLRSMDRTTAIHETTPLDVALHKAEGAQAALTFAEHVGLLQEDKVFIAVVPEGWRVEKIRS